MKEEQNYAAGMTEQDHVSHTIPAGLQLLYSYTGEGRTPMQTQSRNIIEILHLGPHPSPELWQSKVY